MREEYGFIPEELRNGVRGKYAGQIRRIINRDALAVLEKLAGTVDAPSDLAAEHDHYLSGTPERADQEP